MKKDISALKISKKYQKLFILSAFVYWAIAYVYTFIQVLSQPHQYYSSGTTTFQITEAAFPLVFFIIALLIIRFHHQRLHRVFHATLATVIAMMLWQAVDILMVRIWHSLQYPWGNGTGLWAVWGKDWLQMAIGWLLFTIVLLFINAKKEKQHD